MHIFRTLSRTLVAAVSSAVMFVPGPASALTITVNNASGSCSSAVDGAGNVTINCSGGTGGTPSCAVSPSSQSIGSSGGAIAQLTASNCGTGTWSSTRAGFAGCSGTTCSDSLPANASSSSVSYTYTFAGSSGTQSATVVQSGSGSTGGGGGGNISCSNIAGITNTKVIPLSWGYASGLSSTAKQGGFGPHDAVVFTVTPPAGKNSFGQLGNIYVSPSGQSSYNTRMLALSDTPCDFSGKLGSASVKRGQETTLYFTVGGYPVDKYGRSNTTNANMNPGQTYYLTVIQEDAVGGNITCNNSSCDTDYKLIPPPGL